MSNIFDQGTLRGHRSHIFDRSAWEARARARRDEHLVRNRIYNPVHNTRHGVWPFAERPLTITPRNISSAASAHSLARMHQQQAAWHTAFTSSRLGGQYINNMYTTCLDRET